MILSEWPGFECEEPLKIMKKQDYLKSDRKSVDNVIIGVVERTDFQILLRK